MHLNSTQVVLHASLHIFFGFSCVLLNICGFVDPICAGLVCVCTISTKFGDYLTHVCRTSVKLVCTLDLPGQQCFRSFFQGLVTELIYSCVHNLFVLCIFFLSVKFKMDHLEFP